jgi:hypothetical protein
MNDTKRAYNTLTSPPGITIRREAKICIHKQTLREYGLEDLKFVTLEYDADKSLLKIRLSVEENPSSFEVIKERGDVRVILCKEWLDENQIPYGDGPAKVFKADWDKSSETILVKLSY